MKRTIKYILISCILISLIIFKESRSELAKDLGSDYIITQIIAWGLILILIIIFLIITRKAPVGKKIDYINNKMTNNNNPNGYYSGRYILNFSEIDKTKIKQAPIFRDLPENKNIYRFYWIAKNFDIIDNSTSLIGAMFLKWINENKLKIRYKEVGLRKVPVYIFNKGEKFEDEIEGKLYKYFEFIDPDLQITDDQMKEWFEENDTLISVWFWDAINKGNDIMLYERKIMEIEKLTNSKTIKCDVDESLLDEAIKVQGLKEFFENFDSMNDKEMIDVKQWQEYLIFAQILGVADKLSKEFNKIYPEYMMEINLDVIKTINSITSDYTYTNYTHDNVYHNPIQSHDYKLGGGGFSSGGGGGGSFGSGGGGGFR